MSRPEHVRPSLSRSRAEDCYLILHGTAFEIGQTVDVASYDTVAHGHDGKFTWQGSIFAVYHSRKSALAWVKRNGGTGLEHSTEEEADQTAYRGPVPIDPSEISITITVTSTTTSPQTVDLYDN